MRGVVYVAYGEPARREAMKSIASLRRHNDLPVTVVSDRPLGGYAHAYAPDVDPGGRLAKLNLDTLSPYEQTCYLDADTRIRSSLAVGFEALDAGWDLVIVPSSRQGNDVLGNCPTGDREATFVALGTSDLLGLQAGVMWFAQSRSVATLFAAWREEWARFKLMDQAAFLRALWRVPVQIWLLGRDWNGGDVVEHRFGRAARRAG